MLRLSLLGLAVAIGCGSTPDEPTPEPTSRDEPSHSRKTAPLRAIPFDNVFSEFRVFETLNPMIEVWTTQEDVAIGRNSSDEDSFFLIGDDEWQDFVVEFEILVPMDQTIHLGVSSALEGSSREFGVIPLEPRRKTWHPLRVTVKNRATRVLDLADDTVLYEGEAPYEAGGLMLYLPIGEQMALRNVRWRVDRALPFEPPVIEPPTEEELNPERFGPDGVDSDQAESKPSGG